MRIPKVFSVTKTLVYTCDRTEVVRAGDIIEIYDQVWNKDSRVFMLGMRFGHGVVKKVHADGHRMDIDIFFFTEMIRLAGLEESILNSTIMHDEEGLKNILSLFREGIFSASADHKIKEMIAEDRLRRFLS